MSTDETICTDDYLSSGPRIPYSTKAPFAFRIRQLTWLHLLAAASCCFSDYSQCAGLLLSLEGLGTYCFERWLLFVYVFGAKLGSIRLAA